MSLTPIRASEVAVKPSPRCPTCAQPMRHHGSSIGYVCCDWKLLYRPGGWFDEDGHVNDDRLAGGTRHVEGLKP